MEDACQEILTSQKAPLNYSEMISAVLWGDEMWKQRLNDVVEQDSMTSSATGDQGREKSGRARAVRDS